MNTQLKQATANQVKIIYLDGHEAQQYCEQIADLRITIFKDFPYLYEGKLEYEKEYLDTYFKTSKSRILLVFDEDKVVGFSSTIPLEEETDVIKKPFYDHNFDISKILYIGEAIIREPYRKQGLLRKFFEHHDSYAQQNNYSTVVFMTVQREDRHPARPADYKNQDDIWKHMGYSQHSSLYCDMEWPRSDTKCIENNRLIFWIKTL